ncbi:TetR/AcrR family transcriptional regulator [Lichenifustis flavocetrariae]|uniref:TetR/AcrR family transcriptional regulator n=1 Tax=Lichenifustis flavocetrariae TaxID=2949735 RepID=A0AA41YWZ3_9HYPH|nr:TetR/AcrR family transcriptional regulator [Lichenifustis flavocetrariae]MCW6508786.1 TetR/AcrR family transcriptional regulator [Lichenifustis flavocetrariae]
MASSVREKIVNAALDRFHVLGFNACSVQNIVEQAGVPKGSFYNYFKSKELLALEVLGIYAQGVRTEMLADASIAPMDRLRGQFAFMAASYKGYGYGTGCLFETLATEASDQTPLIRNAVAQLFDHWTGLAATAIRDGQAAGDIHGHIDPERTARFLINSWQGAVVRMKVTNDNGPLEDFFAVGLAPLQRGT